MRAWIGFWLILLCPRFVMAVEVGTDDADQRAGAREALKEKLAQAERLQIEIERLRKLAGEEAPNVTLRIRLVELSLTKVKNAGPLELPDDSINTALESEEHIALLIQKSLARLVMDKNLTVAAGSESRIRAGTELPPMQHSKAVTALDKLEFAGTEITVKPKLQSDGRLHVVFACSDSEPMSTPYGAPQRQVHEISTDFELGRGEVVVLEGAVHKRIDSVARQIIGLPISRRVTNHVNEIQTFVIVSRGLRSRDDHSFDSDEDHESEGHQTAQSRRISVRRPK
jgi:hypothetical protein